MSEGRLAGKVAIVTGGGGGIGEATCERFARAGASVVVADIDPDTAQATAERIRDSGGEALAVQFDLADSASIAALAEAAMAGFGKIDVLHNNAANTSLQVFPKDTSILDMDSAVWDAVFAANVRGTMEVTRAVVPHMIAGGRGGSIIITSSGAGQMGQMTMSAYGPSKGALNAFTRYAALQFAPHRIRCNALVLPVVLTKSLESLFSREQIEDVVSRTPFKEPTRPADVAAVAEFLASDDARLITGKLWEM